jgi:nitrite reductase (NO-forming)
LAKLDDMKRSSFLIAGIALVAALASLLPAAAGATAKTRTVAVTAGKPAEFGFNLSTKTFPHGAVAFKVTNGGQIAHDFKICASPKGGSANTCAGKVTKLLAPGQSGTLTYTFKTKGTYEYLCTVPGHAAAGMKGDLKVT